MGGRHGGKRVPKTLVGRIWNYLILTQSVLSFFFFFLSFLFMIAALGCLPEIITHKSLSLTGLDILPRLQSGVFGHNRDAANLSQHLLEGIGDAVLMRATPPLLLLGE